jgi:hypothetical protein
VDQVVDEFRGLTTLLRKLQVRIGALYQQLATAPTAAAELELDVLREERDAVMLRWAGLALQWRMSGGEIVLRRDGADVSEGPLPEDPDNPEATISSGPDLLSDPPAPSIAESIEEDEMDLSILDSVVLGPSWSHEQAPAPDFDVTIAQEIVKRMGPPRADLTREELLSEATALDSEINRIQFWERFPRGVQRSILGVVASRMRRLQDDTDSQLRSLLSMQLKKGFAKLTQFSAEHQPGWVNGLSRSHGPQTGSWLGDADFWWSTLRRELGGFVMEAERASLNPEVALREVAAIAAEASPSALRVRRAATRALNAGVAPDDQRLLRPLMPHLASLAGDKGLKRLRKAIRGMARSQGDDPPESIILEPESGIPSNWPLRALTEGRAAVMIGGEAREQRRAPLQAAFGFESLEWVGGYDIRAVQSLAARVTGGRVEFVLLLARFISHKVTDILLPACRAAGVPWVMVPQGYGVSGVKLAIERYLGDRLPEPPAPIVDL